MPKNRFIQKIMLRLSIENIIQQLDNITKEPTIKDPMPHQTTQKKQTPKYLSQSTNESEKVIKKPQNKDQHFKKTRTQSAPVLIRYNVKMFKEKSKKIIEEPLNCHVQNN